MNMERTNDLPFLYRAILKAGAVIDGVEYRGDNTYTVHLTYPIKLSFNNRVIEIPWIIILTPAGNQK